MMKHLLKMVWNRKRMNGLIIIEIFVSFLVLFVVLTAATYYIGNYNRPLGYRIDNVWSVHVNSHLPQAGSAGLRAAGLLRLAAAMRDLREIESVGWMYAGPYAHSTWTNGRKYRGRDIEIELNRATDEVKQVLDMQVTAGRWFTKDDDASNGTPVVINEEYARMMFGDENPIGKSPLDSTCRIVGVVKDYRKAGEFSGSVNYQISRMRLEDTSGIFGGGFLVRLRPGTTGAFQEQLGKTLASVERGWSFEIQPLASAREADFKLRLAPLIVGGVIAVFLLLMVALGLIGVLWQNVSQRTKELGLRRALGGTAANVAWQIRGEQFIITTIGVAAGSFLALQLPLIAIFSFIGPEVYLFALGASLLLMYALAYFCSTIPSWLAMDVQPAEALHYE